MMTRSFITRRPEARAPGRVPGLLALLGILSVFAWPRVAFAQAAPAAKRVVAIVPLGKVPKAALEDVAAALEASLDVDARIEPARPLPKEAWYAPRRRWRAEKLLDALDANPPEGAWKVLALTEAEISTTKDAIYDWGIGGLGNIGGRSCVVSTYLIRKHTRASDKARLTERIRKLAVHEFGHTLGLPHCQVMACVMSDAQGKLIRSLDKSAETWCGRCKKMLP